MRGPRRSRAESKAASRAASRGARRPRRYALLFCRSALVRDQPTERYAAAPRSRTSALLQRNSHVDGCGLDVTSRSFVGAHPVRERRPQGGLLGRGRAQGALLQGVAQVWGLRINLAGRLFVGAHPVRDKPTERYTTAWLSRTGCAPTDKRAWQRKMNGAMPKADAQRGPALSPQRFGRVAQRLEVSPVYPRRLSHRTRLERSGLSQHDAAGVIRPFYLGYFRREASPVGSLGPAREK